MPQSYGLLSKSDINILQACLSKLMGKRDPTQPIRVLEIGVWSGATAIKMRDFIASKGHTIHYTGIENGASAAAIKAPPFPEARMLIGDSIAVREAIDDREQFDLVLIDGCHCLTHACMDFLRYQSLVVPGGFALFHDINPAFQGEKQHHASGDHESMPMRVAVIEALRLLGLIDNRFPGWAGSMSEWEPGCSNGFFIAWKLTPQEV